MNIEMIDEYINEISNNIEILTNKLNDLTIYKELITGKSYKEDKEKILVKKIKKNKPIYVNPRG